MENMRYCLRVMTDAAFFAAVLLGPLGCRMLDENSDAAVPDAAVPLDASVAGDLLIPLDLATPQDLRLPWDFANPSADTTDLAEIPDLIISRDFLPPPDMIPPYGTDASLCFSAPKPKACVPRKQVFPLPILLPAPPWPLVVGIGDLDGDGLNDVAVTNQFSGKVGVILNKGDGTFAKIVEYDMPMRTDTFAIEIKDIDNDGLADVLIGANGCALGVLRNRGGGVLDHWTRADSPTFASSMFSFADINCDGFLDVVNQASFFLNRRDGTFADAVMLLSSDPTDWRYSAWAGDLDGDGWPEVATHFAIFNGRLNISSNRGGLFSPLLAEDFPNSSVPVLVDLNKDGFLDLAMSADSALGDGKGHLGKPIGIPSLAIPIMADINNDGSLDRVSNENCSLAVTLGRGDGTFDPILKSPRGQICIWHKIAVGDLDGDCWPDAASTTFDGGGGVALITNQHDGTFK